MSARAPDPEPAGRPAAGKGAPALEREARGEALLEVRDLHVSFRTEEGIVRAVNGASFAVEPGEVLGIVGESGSGKSVTMLAVMGLITDRNASLRGEIVFKGRELSRRSQREMQSIRGEEMAMIFQDPMTSLNPVYRVGWQIAEQLRAHEHLSRAQANARAAELLDAVGIPHAAERARSYPHEFSGGMRQRVMIAMALSCSPDLLIADEPTTALDVTIQAQILDLIKRLRSEYRSSVVLVTHDIGVIAEVADRVLVMYAGRIVEQGTTRELFRDPQHPYTWGLLGSAPRLDRPRPRRLAAIPGQPPSMLHLPAACAFAPRCKHAFARCHEEVPPLEVGPAPSHLDACHLSLEQKRRLRAPAIAAGGAPAA